MRSNACSLLETMSSVWETTRPRRRGYRGHPRAGLGNHVDGCSLWFPRPRRDTPLGIGILGGLHVPRRFVIPIFMVIFVFYSLKEFEYLNDTYMFYKMEGSNMRARCQRR